MKAGGPVCHIPELDGVRAFAVTLAHGIARGHVWEAPRRFRCDGVFLPKWIFDYDAAAHRVRQHKHVKLASILPTAGIAHISATLRDVVVADDARADWALRLQHKSKCSHL